MREVADLRGLMIMAQCGDKCAYRLLLENVEVILRRYYSRRLPSPVVDDAIQDTIMALHERRHTYDPDRMFKAWLMGIARHKWVDHVRRLRRNAVEELLLEAPAPECELEILCAIILRDLLYLLKPPQAEAIRLVKLEGFSVREAADRTGQSCGSVKMNIHRGMRKLSQAVLTT